ncbi:MAG: hypothetical protein EOP42_24585 [Sphingobacteriaceae bacterium]|nr:MAG: hypothetical protein EOP42_24585 [Sphingobacteriaceae bacterium]
MEFFKLNQRQDSALIFQIMALIVSWVSCYLTDYTFGVFLLTEMLVAGAITYSNQSFLKYDLKRTVLLVIGTVISFSLFRFVMEFIWIGILLWIKPISNDPVIIDSVLSYILITVILKLIQTEIKIGLYQSLILTTLLLVYGMFLYNNPAFSNLPGRYYSPFFINQFLVSIYAVSMLDFAKQELAETVQTQLIDKLPQPKKLYRFVKFTLLTLLGVGMLFLLFALLMIWMLSGSNFGPD